MKLSQTNTETKIDSSTNLFVVQKDRSWILAGEREREREKFIYYNT